jgi:sigma-B regulation protein RsbU (phosphoserine phosphatase)
MSRSLFSSAPAAGLAVDLGPSLTHNSYLKEAGEQELEAELAELRKDYAEVRSALFEASQMYRRLCAPGLVRHSDFEIASETFAARNVPGDFITIRQNVSSAMLGLGDITGKGLAAGMWTTLLLGLLGLHGNASPEPEVIVEGVNRDLCRASIGAPLSSLFLARLDWETGRLDYCSAGHPPALLLRQDGPLELLSDGGPLLGAVAEASFVKGSVNLRDRDVLVAYSDGILEAHDYSDQEFGFDRLQDQVRHARDRGAGEILFSVLAAVQDFVSGCPQADDMSVVVLQRRAPQDGTLTPIT